ncbi:copper amine oxidase-like domain-containing protein [Pseudobacteroides cellulosolvens ATCC 35603 = DSM 2933]|uniref:Copper amine oxidase-like domain-containing protein n=2 Tax=Pseudobacteroides cellulosolvens TaxID=35825 RepID=A0A0L6JKT0_9FIRM|nr:copper amine oxidase-like domain-containing protein [Pseudobacteroides cellulosolvens ATCC 35603 = DSM 2933]
MIPLRSIFEACGIVVKWDDKKKTVSDVKGRNKLVLKADSKIALVNNKEKTLYASPIIINNRMYIPLRFVSESFGFKVKWSGDTNTVEINTN